MIADDGYFLTSARHAREISLCSRAVFVQLWPATISPKFMIKMETLRSPPSGLLGRSLSELSGLIDEKERAYLQRLSDGPVASTCPYESMSVGADDSDGTPDIPDGPLDLESLIRQIQLQLAHKKELPLRSRLKIQQLMRQYDLGLGELDRYSHFDAGKKYTRNLIAHDDSFTLMLLCW